MAFTGSPSDDVQLGTVGDDAFDYSQGGNDTLSGLGGNDTFTMGGAFNALDTIDGGSGSDTLVLNGNYSGGVTFSATTLVNVETVNLTAGVSNFYNLTLNAATVTAGQRMVINGPGNGNAMQVDGSAVAGGLNIINSAGADTIFSGSGNDTLISRGGNDVMNGGGGRNRLAFAGLGHGVTVNLTLQGQSQNTSVGNMTLSNFQDLSGTNFADILTGDENANTILGNGGNDTIDGGGGDDLISVGGISLGAGNVPGLPTNAIADGGTGNDTLSFYAAPQTVTIPGSPPTVITLNTGLTFDLSNTGAQQTALGTITQSNFENLVGTAFDDDLTGDSGDNILYGADGSDNLSGGAGNDTLYGDKLLALGATQPSQGFDVAPTLVDAAVGGNDSLRGGAGDDILDGGAGNNAALYDDATGDVTVNLSISGPQAVGGGLGSDTLISIQNLLGGDYNDQLTGDGNDNVLVGGKGNDTLIGGAGNDTLYGGNYPSMPADSVAGHDILIGGTGDDTLIGTNFAGSTAVASYADATSGVTVNLAVSGPQAVGGGLGNDTLTNITGLIGSGSYDFLTGDNNDNVFTGGAGNDTINGGAGTDTAIFSGNLAQYQITGSDGTFFVAGPDGTDTLTGVEFAQFADQTIPLVTNNFTGTSGDDTLTGNNNDNLFDFSLAPGGTDVAFGLGGSDTAKFAGSVASANATGWSADGVTATIGAENITLHGIEFVQFDDATLALGTGNNDVMGPIAGVNGYVAGSGDDTISPGAGIFTIFAGDGTDTVVLSGNRADWSLSFAPDQAAVLSAAGSEITLEDVETVHFDDGSVILGTPNGDVLTGTAGDDYFIAGKGNDTLNGGAGTDTAIFSGNRSQYIIDLSGPITVSGPDGVDTLNNIEYAQFADSTVHFTGGIYTGTSGGDSQTGTLFDDQFNYGQGGNDTLSGLGGNDTFNLGGAFTAADVIDGGAGSDTLNLSGDYSAGVTLSATTLVNVETITLAAGNNYSLITNDATVALGQTMTIDGSALGAGDTLTVNGSAESNGSLVITGGAGNDVLTSGVGNDVLTGGGGNDSFTLVRGGNDTVTGGSGNDLFVVRGGNDVINGNGGRDRLVISGITQGASVDLNLQGQVQNTGLGSLTLSGIQDIGGSTFADVLTGDGNDNTILGNGGNDVISGGGGNDLISVGGLGLLPTLPFTAGLASNAIADGGSGNDTLSFYTALQSITVPGSPPTIVTLNAGVTADLSNTSAQATGLGTITQSNFENLQGTRFDDDLTGDSGDNILYGADGSDNLSGGAGNDTLYGDKLLSVGSNQASLGYALTPTLLDATVGGDDSLRGGAGDDILDGGAGNNAALYDDATGDVTVNLSISGPQAVGGGLGSDTLISIQNLLGGDYNDQLTGDGNDNVLVGGKGNDTLIGGAGNDTLYGGNYPTMPADSVAGHDILIGGTGDDTLIGTNFAGSTAVASYADATSGVTVNLAVSGPQAVGGGLGNDTLTNITGLIGSGSDDFLTGDGNDNVFTGGAGNDTINGGAGTDTAIFSGTLAQYQISNSNGTVTISGPDGTDTLTGVELAQFADQTIVLAGATLTGTTGNDIQAGTNFDDQFNYGQGGNDTLSGLGGNDTFNMGGAFTAADAIDGGAGTDTLNLNGNYTAGVIFSATTLLNVEQINLAAGNNYKLTTNDATVAAGSILNVDASQLGASNALTFIGSAETDGKFSITGGAGNDTLTGGAGDDTFDISKGGNDTVVGGNGNDTINLGVTLTSADRIDGGAGSDTVVLDGISLANASTTVALSATTMVNVETLLLRNSAVNITTNNATVAAGQTLTVDASLLGASNQGLGPAYTLTFNGAAETDGNFVIKGFAGHDALTGGAGNDIFDISFGGDDTVSGGGGNDTILAGNRMTAATTINGGAGSDTLSLSGDYSGGQALAFTATTLVNVETITLATGNSYNLTTNDATVASGASLTVDGSALGAADKLTLNGTAETNGSLVVLGGVGNDVLTGGVGADTLNGGAGNDQIDISRGGNDTVNAGSGDDVIIAGGALTALDKIDGGSGSDTLTMTATTVVLNATTLVNVENLTLAAGGGVYNITTNDATVAAGQTLTVDGRLVGGTVTFNGSAEKDGNFVIFGGLGNDVLTGGAGNDLFNDVAGNNTFNIGNGGNDTVIGGSGNDTINAGAALTALDTINGGSGSDTLNLNGNYSGGVIFSATTLTSVETITLSAGNNYSLTTNDATVAAGQTLTVNGTALAAANVLTFDGSAETDGSLIITGGAGNDILTGGAGNDTLNGAGGNDTFNISRGGNDAVVGGTGTDTIIAGGALTAVDAIDGGAGNDTLSLNGNYSAGLTFGATTLINVETITLAGGNSYNLTTNDATVASGATLTVDGSALGAGDSLTFNGSAETNGKFAITGGAGNDVLTGGLGNDTLNSGDGADTIDITRGGNDIVSAGNGSDTIIAGGALTALDAVDGGAGIDTIKLTATTVVLSATTLVNVENIVLADGTYNITTNNATVGAGQSMTVDGSALTTSSVLTFSGAAETDGSFTITGGAGNDVLTGGAGNDVLMGGAGSNTLSIANGGNDTVVGGTGNDTINAGAALTASDTIDGGAGADTLNLNGNYSGGITFSAATLLNVENIVLAAGNSYRLTTNDATVAAGQNLSVNGTALAAANNLIFDGSAEFNGNFGITGGAGNDILTGGLRNDIFDITRGGNDTVNAGIGNDTIVAGGALTASDSIDGGVGNDVVTLTATSVVLGAATLTNVETLKLAAGNYNITTNDANVASGQSLRVDGSALVSGNTLTFNGAAESNGSFVIQSAVGVTDNLVGGAGNDIFAMGAGLLATDKINGGAGADMVTLNGNYSAGLTFSATTLLNVETISLAAGNSYNLTTNNATVAAGQSLTIDGSTLTKADSLIFNGAAETNGNLIIMGGAGNNSLTGGAGNDVLSSAGTLTNWQHGFYPSNTFDISGGGNDVVYAGIGINTVIAGAALTAADSIIGALGSDTRVQLSGNYSAGLTLAATTLQNVSLLSLATGFNYKLTASDGQDGLTVDARALGKFNTLTFDGSAETSSGFTIHDGAGADKLIGGAGNDVISLEFVDNSNVVNAGAGDDTIYVYSLDDSDSIDGGAGYDTVVLDGHPNALGVPNQFKATTMRNIEKLVLAGPNFDLTTSGSTVAAGQNMLVDGSSMDDRSTIRFFGSSELGSFTILAGRGNDTLAGGKSDDTIDISTGGDDTVVGNGGNDTIIAGGALTALDNINGGLGNDTLTLNGNYSANVTFSATTLRNVETVNLAGSNSYNLTTNDATVAFGATLTVDGSALGAGDSLTFDGSAESDGSFVIVGGAGADDLTGGKLGDTLSGGGGADTFRYSGAADSTSVNYDTIVGFDAASDMFWMPGAVNAVDAPVTTGALSSGASFDGDLAAALAGSLAAHDALLFTADSGSLAGQTFLIVDGNGVAGYQAGSDYVIALQTGANLGNLTAANFRHDTVPVIPVISGTPGNDILTSIAGNETFDISAGGDDIVTGGAGDNKILAGRQFTALDGINGGAGNDTLLLTGNYKAGVVMSATTLLDVETIALSAGGNYVLTSNDATVGAGQSLTVDGSALLKGDSISFNGSAESDGSFLLIGGLGNDVLTGGAGNDVLIGGGGFDLFDISSGGVDLVIAGSAGTQVLAGGALTAADTIIGGQGGVTVQLNGNYSAGLTFSATTLQNVGYISLAAGNSYNLTSADATVAAGARLTIDGSALGQGNRLIFDGSAETDGSFIIYDGAGDDVLTGGAGNDQFRLSSAGGYNIVHAGTGDDVIAIHALEDADVIDGGAGYDTVQLDGASNARALPNDFRDTTLQNVERVVLGNNGSTGYNLTTRDATVAAGQNMLVIGQQLSSSSVLKFNGGAETDGSFTIISGAANDVLAGGLGNDTFDISWGGNDVVNAGIGNDTIIAGDTLTTADNIDGGAGYDTLTLSGNYSAGLTFGVTTLRNVENITLAAGNSYTLTTNSATVTSGQVLTVDGSALSANDILTFDGSANTNGRFVILGGAGADMLSGGLLGDTLTSGGGADTFKYAGAGYSTSVNYDTIVGFDGASDKLWLPTAVLAVDAPVATGALSSGASFDNDLTAAIAGHMAANDAVLFTADSGSLAGQTFLIVDGNGTAGYQASSDYVIALTAGTNLNSLAAANFHT